MIGGTFNGHPWDAGENVTITVHDTEHPISKPWGDEFEIQDEIYQFKNWQPEKVRVLMSLNMAKTKLKEPYHVPIAWCKDYGDGKVFHMSLGHNEGVWEDRAATWSRCSAASSGSSAWKKATPRRTRSSPRPKKKKPRPMSLRRRSSGSAM